MKSRVILFVLFLTSVIALSLAVAPAPPVAAAPDTYTVTSASCTGPGSITEAMALANANPGEDTITFTKDLQISADQCSPIRRSIPFFLQATESVIFEGNGARLVGHIGWVTSGGVLTPIGPEADCPGETEGDLITAETPGFILVGKIGKDNSAITVTVRDLDMHELNSVATIEKNASLILEDLSLNRIIAGRSSCGEPAIRAGEGANFTARRTEWDTIWNANRIIPVGDPNNFISFIPVGAIQGGGGDLNIEESRFKDVWQAGTISWTGPQINIVSSRFEGAQGIFTNPATQVATNIVNSIWSDEVNGAPSDSDRIANGSTGEMNIVASTILYPSVECDRPCREAGSRGWIYTQRGGGKINFKQSAVGVNFPDTSPSPSVELLDPGAGAGFTADEYTWIQPTALQDADALKTLTNQPNLLTKAPGLRIEGFFTLAEWATPLDPGELIDIVPDAVCDDNNQANDGANALRNPIDGTCITEDALGNPRVDANGARNSGAVQLALAPFLTVTGTGVQTVDLSWTKPQFSAPTTGITGYELRYRETGAATWTSVPPVVGPDNLSVQVGNLTSGTEYEFQVRATYEPPGEGPWSNTATGTPLGPIGTPVVTATPGNKQVDLSWTKPDDGGRVIDAYVIQWRPVGTTDWTGATSTTGTDTNPPATQTTITGLTNGTEYEFAVTATATNGDTGPQGTATATPFKSVQPPEPGIEDCTLTAGYWSTHSEYGPSLYDSTWAKLANGADTPFFLSGQSYYQVINSAPKGDAYYNLAHQYIAAELNFLRGADPAAVQAEFDAAKALFEKYTPAHIAGLPGDDPLRTQFIDLAYTLDQYNMGVIGPGYCTE